MIKNNFIVIGHDGHGKTTLIKAVNKMLAEKGDNSKCFDEIHGNENIDSVGKTICGAVLVVAATDGPTQQTLDQLRRIRQIGISNIVVFMSKCDLVDEVDVLDLVDMEIRDALSKYEYDGNLARIVQSSAFKAMEGNAKFQNKISELINIIDSYIPPSMRWISSKNLQGASSQRKGLDADEKRIPVIMQLPIRENNSLKGVVDLVQMKAFYIEDAKKGNVFGRNIPSEFIDQVNAYREKLIDCCANYDDNLMELAMEGKYSADEVDENSIKNTIYKQTLSRKLIPIFFDIPYKNSDTAKLASRVLKKTDLSFFCTMRNESSTKPQTNNDNCDVKEANLAELYEKRNKASVRSNVDNDGGISKKEKFDAVGSVIAQQTGTSIYTGQVKFTTPHGHGFAAERANNVNDVLFGRDAKIVGDDNALNGADRIVDGVQLQSKYCATSHASVNAAFEDGSYRYFNADGSPMALEVPKGQGAEAVKIMTKKIQDGKVPGVTDPKKAKDLIREGSVTYEQACNIARFGTIDGLIYDAKNACVQVKQSAHFIGLGAVIVFCKSVWDGKNFDAALTDAGISALKAGGFIWLHSVIVSEISKIGAKQAVSETLSPAASRALLGASGSSALRGNVVSMGVSVSILSAKDFYNFFSGDISFQQLTKNILHTASGVAGGAAGAAVGTAVLPGVGTVVGGILGGAIASSKAKKVLDELIEDDAKRMMTLVQNTWAQLSSDYLLSQYEAKLAMGEFKTYTEQHPDFLKDIFRSADQEFEAAFIIEPIIEAVAATRQEIVLPTKEECESKLISIANMSFSGEIYTENKTTHKKKTMTKNDKDIITDLLVYQVSSLAIMSAVCLITWFFEWNSLFAMSRHLLFFIPSFMAVSAFANEEREELSYSNILFAMCLISGGLATVVFIWGIIGAGLAFFDVILWLTFWDFGFTLLVLSFPFTLISILLAAKYLIFNSAEADAEEDRINRIKKLSQEFRDSYISRHVMGGQNENA